MTTTTVTKCKVYQNLRKLVPIETDDPNTAKWEDEFYEQHQTLDAVLYGLCGMLRDWMDVMPRNQQDRARTLIAEAEDWEVVDFDIEEPEYWDNNE